MSIQKEYTGGKKQMENRCWVYLTADRL